MRPRIALRRRRGCSVDVKCRIATIVGPGSKFELSILFRLAKACNGDLGVGKFCLAIGSLQEPMSRFSNTDLSMLFPAPYEYSG